MRKIFCIILAGLTLTLSFSACGKKDDSSAKAKYQSSDSCEDALKELYSAIYQKDGGELFYLYTYPDIALEQMKQNGSYETLIKTYNDTQRSLVDVIKQVPEITEFTAVTPLTQSQLGAAKRYFAALVSEVIPNAAADDINITEAYELKCNIIDFNGQPASDTECMVKLAGEGWKVITQSTGALVSNFPEETT